MRLFAVSVAPAWSRVDRTTFSIALALERRFQRRPVEPEVVMSHACGGKTCFEPPSHGFAIERQNAGQRPYGLFRRFDDAPGHPFIDDFGHGTAAKGENRS